MSCLALGVGLWLGLGSVLRLLLLLVLFACKQGVMVRAIVVGRLVGGGKTRFFVAVLPDYIYLGLGSAASIWKCMARRGTQDKD